MSTHYETRKVRINGAHRWKDSSNTSTAIGATVYGTSTKFTIDLANQFGLENVKKMVVKSWSVSNLFYNIDEYRNKLYYYDLDDDVLRTVQISIGNYNINTLITTLQDALTNTLADLTGDAVVTTGDIDGSLMIDLPCATDRYRFASLSQLHQMHERGDLTDDGHSIHLPSLNYIIGIAPDYEHLRQPFRPWDGTKIRFIMDVPVNLAGLQQVFLCLDNITSFNTIDSSGKANSVADELSLTTTPFGFGAFKECADAALSIFHWDNNISIRNIQLSIQDAWNNILTLPWNADVIVNLKIYY
jgi:hypothetical protein